MARAVRLAAALMLLSGGYLACALAVFAVVRDSLTAGIVTATLSLAAYVVLRARRGEWLAYQPDPTAGRGDPDQSGNAVGLTLLCLVLAFLAGQSFAIWLYVRAGSASFDRVTDLQDQAAPWLMLLFVLVVAPLGEEAFFRGILYPRLRRQASPLVAAVLTTVAFASFHGNLVQVTATIPLALVLAIVFERWRRLWPVVALHVSYNVAATVIPAQLVAGLAVWPVVVVLLIGFGYAFSVLCRQLSTMPEASVCHGA